jgi:hypothetical protein
MKTILYFILLNLGLTATAFAVPGTDKDAEKRAKCHTEWMKTELKLKGWQVKKVEKINMDISKKLEDFKYKSEDVPAITAKAKELDVERTHLLEEVLTPEQVFHYEKMSDRMSKLAGACILSMPTSEDH